MAESETLVEVEALRPLRIELPRAPAPGIWGRHGDAYDLPVGQRFHLPQAQAERLQRRGSLRLVPPPMAPKPEEAPKAPPIQSQPPGEASPAAPLAPGMPLAPAATPVSIGARATRRGR